jgi:hypothetical protein
VLCFDSLQSASSSDTDCPRIAQEAAKLATSSTSKQTTNAAAQHLSTATSGVKESKHNLGSSSFAAAKLSENTSKLTSSHPWASQRAAVGNSKLSTAQPSHASPLAGRKLEGYDARSFPVTKPQRSRPASEVVLSASRTSQRISSSPSADLGWLLSKAAIVPPHCGSGNATANATLYTTILAPSSANMIVNSTGIASPPRSPRSLRYLPKNELPQTIQFGFQPESSAKGSVSVTKAQFQSTASGVSASKSQATTTSSLWSKGNSRVPIASPPRSPQLNRLPGTSQAREKITRASQFSSSDSHKSQQSPLLQRKATVSFSGGVSQMPTTSPHSSPIPVRRQPGTQHAQIQLTLSDEKLQQQQRAAESSQSLAVVTVTPSVTRPLSSSQVFPVRSPNMTRKSMPVHRAISDTPVSPVAGSLNSPLVRRQQSSSSSVSGGVTSRDEGPLSARSVDQALAELTSVLDSMQQQQQSASLEKLGNISPNISQTSLLVSTSSAFTAVAPSSTQSSQLSAVSRRVMSPGCSAAALTLVDGRSQHADEDAQERRSSLSSLSSHGDHANATAVR